MIFALRGIAVSLALFALSYCALSVLVASSWRMFVRLRNVSPRTMANSLIALRLLPLALSFLGTFMLVVPSFVLMEPRSTEEEIGVAPFLLGVICVFGLTANLARAFQASSRTNQLVSEWVRDARALELGVPALAISAPRLLPPLTVAGVCRPRLLLSETALSLLTSEELKAAVRHEIAHIQFRDNFKKLACKIAWFPGMGPLDNAWQRAAELAADDAAVSDSSQALDLAAALVKVLRHCKSGPIPEISMGFIQDLSVRARIERLLHWEDAHSKPVRRSHWWLISFPVAGVITIGVHYGNLLAQIHLFTEWLVR